MRSLFLQITTTGVALCTQKYWVLGKSVKLRSYQDIIFGFVIIKTKLLKMLTCSHNIFNGLLQIKSFTKPKILRSCTACDPL